MSVMKSAPVFMGRIREVIAADAVCACGKRVDSGLASETTQILRRKSVALPPAPPPLSRGHPAAQRERTHPPPPSRDIMLPI
jgi:hypothetical protein